MEVKAQAMVAKNGSNTYKKSCYVYLGYGYGYGGQKSATNFGVVIQVNDKSVLAYSAQATRLTKLVSGGFIISKVSPVKQTTSTTSSLLFGRIIKKSWGHMIIMAGPSLVGSTHYEHPLYFGGYSGEDILSPGLSMQANINPASKFIGLGAILFVNFSSAYTHAGITVNLSLGNVHYKQKLQTM